jgi:hypothetical protein
MLESLCTYLQSKLDSLLTVNGYESKVYKEINYETEFVKGEVPLLLVEGTVNQTDFVAKTYNESVQLYCWTEREAASSNVLKTAGFNVSYNLMFSLFHDLNMLVDTIDGCRIRFVWNAPVVMDFNLPVGNGYECRLMMQGTLYFTEKAGISLDPSYTLTVGETDYSVDLIDPVFSMENTGTNEESDGTGKTYIDFPNVTISFSAYMRDKAWCYSVLSDIFGTTRHSYALKEEYLANYQNGGAVTLMANSSIATTAGLIVSNARSILGDVPIGLNLSLNGYSLYIDSADTHTTVYDSASEKYYSKGDILPVADGDILVCLPGSFYNWEMHKVGYTPNRTLSGLVILKGNKSVDTLTGLTLLSLVMGVGNGNVY